MPFPRCQFGHVHETAAASPYSGLANTEVRETLSIHHRQPNDR